MISFTFHLSIESKHEVTILGGLNEFVVKFYGPQGSKYMRWYVFFYYSLLLLSENIKADGNGDRCSF